MVHSVNLLLLVLKPVDFRGSGQGDRKIVLVDSCGFSSGDLSDGNRWLMDVRGPYEVGDAGFERGVFLLGERGGVIAEDGCVQDNRVHTLECNLGLVSYCVCGKFLDCDFIFLTHSKIFLVPEGGLTII